MPDSQDRMKLFVTQAVLVLGFGNGLIFHEMYIRVPLRALLLLLLTIQIV